MRSNVVISSVCLVLICGVGCLSKTTVSFEQGTEHLEQGRFSEAVGELEAAYEEDPEVDPALPQRLARAHVEVGFQAFASNDLANAKKHFLRAVEVSPGTPRARLGLGQIYVEQGNISRAREALQRAMESPDPDVGHRAKVLIAETHYVEGDYPTALRMLNEALESRPDDTAARRTLGRVFLDAGEDSEAIMEFERALSIDPKSARTQYHLGEALLRVGKPEQAAQRIQRAMFLDSAYLTDAQARTHLGDAYFEQRLFERAFKEYDRAVELTDAVGSELAKRVTMAAYHTNRMSVAHRYLDRAIAKYGSDPELSFYRGALAYADGEYDSAASHLNDAEQAGLVAEIPDLARLLGLLALREGNDEEALAYFEQFVSMGGESAEASFQVGRARRSRGDLDQAVSHLSKAVSLDPKHAEARFSLALTYKDLGQYSAATNELQELVTLKPTYAPAHLELGIIYARAIEDYKRAVEHWQRFLSLRPDSPQAAAIRNNMEILKTKIEPEDDDRRRRRRR